MMMISCVCEQQLRRGSAVAAVAAAVDAAAAAAVAGLIDDVRR